MRKGIACLFWLSSCLLVVGAAASELATPAELYGELFERVQLSDVYEDSKTFADALPDRPPAQLLAEYRRLRTREGFDLSAFVAEHFTAPPDGGVKYQAFPDRDVRAYIDALWTLLTREPEVAHPYSSRLPLPQRYVVPGGRFTEIYYWDSYFTMLGLEESGRHDLTLSMLENFAWLIARYGHVPNGNRSYYLSRSQPPFFAFMVELVAARDGESVYVKYLPQLRAEYAFWMDGAAALAPGAAHRRVVRMPDGALLNRYWDDRDTPREEAYKEDVATARAADRSPAEVYRNLRAAAESGWDFSSRWLADGKTLATIRTVELVPPDLNSLLYHLELTIAKACGLVTDVACVGEAERSAAQRKAAVHRYLWNPRVGAFTDYDLRAQKSGARVSAATLYPLYVKLAETAQARAVARTVRTKLLKRHGLVTTTVRSGQQWDAPNGWAPLQWMASEGLKHYGHDRLAAVVTRRWVAKNVQLYRATGTLVEKYDVEGAGRGRGGEYPLQYGFGWTNGVLRKLLDPGAEPAR